MNDLHIVFDIDGVLSDFHGDVTPELCQQLREKGAKLWMLSKRDDEMEANQIQSKYGLKQISIVSGKRNYVDTKLESLKTFMNKHPKARFVYVGDRTEDFFVALMSGAVYCSHSALSMEIFEEANYVKAVLCGGECGEKSIMEAT